MKKILYVGGFEMPDGNAAAQRVLAIAKTIRGSFDISFLGVTRNANMSGSVDGFEYVNLPYPSSKKEWLSHLTGAEELKAIKDSNPDIVIAYNFPAWGLYRITKYCKQNGIKIIGDITEWYQARNLVKWLDTEWRMKSLNKQMDGLIVISRYLHDYYKSNKSFHMPPTVDINRDKFIQEQPRNNEPGTISLLYAGSPGKDDKDRLDELMNVLGNYSNLSLDVVGITEDLFRQKFPEATIPDNAKFWGRQSHEKTIEMLCNCDFSIFFRRPSRVNNAGFPTKFAEAQSVGIPIIASHFSDLDEFVVEGKNGFLAEDISRHGIEKVLDKVSALSRQEIQAMHNYTGSLGKFDYRRYKESLTQFMESI